MSELLNSKQASVFGGIAFRIISEHYFDCLDSEFRFNLDAPLGSRMGNLSVLELIIFESYCIASCVASASTLDDRNTNEIMENLRSIIYSLHGVPRNGAIDDLLEPKFLGGVFQRRKPNRVYFTAVLSCFFNEVFIREEDYPTDLKSVLQLKWPIADESHFRDQNVYCILSAFLSNASFSLVNRDTPRLATTGLAAASAFRNGTADYLTSISNLALDFEEAFRAAQA